jgi:hypothetical protein
MSMPQAPLGPGAEGHPASGRADGREVAIGVALLPRRRHADAVDPSRRAIRHEDVARSIGVLRHQIRGVRGERDEATAAVDLGKVAGPVRLAASKPRVTRSVVPMRWTNGAAERPRPRDA